MSYVPPAYSDAFNRNILQAWYVRLADRFIALENASPLWVEQDYGALLGYISALFMTDVINWDERERLDGYATAIYHQKTWKGDF